MNYLLICFGVLMGFASQCLAYDWNRSLSGLEGVEINIQFAPSHVDAEITRQIRRDVEIRLKLAGIEVLSANNDVQTEQNPELSVRIILHKQSTPTGGYIHGIQVQVLEKVSLVRNPDAMATASTWEAVSVGSFGKDFRGLRFYVNEVVDGFVNAWLSANPKRQSNDASNQ